jgi:hypothetical protein
MASTRQMPVRVSMALEADARRGAPELEHLDFATLVRVGLARLAGKPLADALAVARTKPGPKPREAAGR